MTDLVADVFYKYECAAPLNSLSYLRAAQEEHLRKPCQAGDCRQRYITALQAADRHEYGPLLEFVRS